MYACMYEVRNSDSVSRFCEMLVFVYIPDQFVRMFNLYYYSVYACKWVFMCVRLCVTVCVCMHACFIRDVSRDSVTESDCVTWHSNKYYNMWWQLNFQEDWRRGKQCYPQQPKITLAEFSKKLSGIIKWIYLTIYEIQYITPESASCCHV